MTMISRRRFAALAASFATGLAALPARAGTATIRLTITKVGFIVGVGGGRGTLTMNGVSYPFRVGGVSLGATIGGSSTNFRGPVTNINTPADIEGVYTAVGAGAAVVAGGGAVVLQNNRGVTLQLTGQKVGFEVSAALSGMSVTLG